MKLRKIVKILSLRDLRGVSRKKYGSVLSMRSLREEQFLSLVLSIYEYNRSTENVTTREEKN